VLIALLLAALPLVGQPPEGCLAAAAVSALRAEGIAAPDATSLMREVHVFTDGIEPADLSKELKKRGLVLLRFQPKPNEVVKASAEIPLLLMLSPGHVVAVFQGQAMDPEAPRLFNPGALEIKSAKTAFFVGDAALLAKAGRHFEVSRWQLEDSLYRARVYASRAALPGADAVALFEAAIDANPRDAKLHNDLGVALARKGDAARAIAAFDQALLLEPKLAEAQRNRARARALLKPPR
jgi:tetratricopeptide (TPR) repeat protein